MRTGLRVREGQKRTYGGRADVLSGEGVLVGAVGLLGDHGLLLRSVVGVLLLVEPVGVPPVLGVVSLLRPKGAVNDVLKRKPARGLPCDAS